jgi:hypothetical protein
MRRSLTGFYGAYFGVPDLKDIEMNGEYDRVG